MTEPDPTVYALLERATSDDFGDPPVDAVVARGRRARRRLHTMQVSTLVIAAVLVIFGVVRLQSRSTTTGPTAPPPSGPTAEQLAHGSWQRVAAAPFQLCEPTAAWDGTGLVVVQPKAQSDCAGPGAAVYDPVRNVWQRIASLPSSLGSQVSLTSNGNEVVAVSEANGKVVVWHPGAASWQSLPSRPDPEDSVTSLTWSGDDLVVTAIQVGAADARPGGAHVEELRDGHWHPLPSPPAANPDVDVLAGAELRGKLYVLMTTGVVSPTRFSSGDLTSQLFRLDGSHWTAMATPSGLPQSDYELSPVGSGLLAIGSDCPPGPVPCTLLDMSATLFLPGHKTALFTHGAAVSTNTAFATIGGGNVVISQALRNTTGTTVAPGYLKLGSTTIYNATTHRSLRGPDSGEGPNSIGTFWTPDGVVAFGEAAQGAGLILQPSARDPHARS